MIQRANSKRSILLSNILKGAASLTFLFMLIEFFDELNYGVGNAALPALEPTWESHTSRWVCCLDCLASSIHSLSQCSCCSGIPASANTSCLGGGLAIALSLVAIASTRSFPLVLVAMVIGFPASGAFVSLSQATLMDLNPGREPQMMARWTVAGSLANLIGPLILAGGFALGFGWRWAYFGMALICLVLVGMTWLRHIPMHSAVRKLLSNRSQSGNTCLQGLWEAVRNPHLMRWMILLQFSDLLLDVLTGYLALYFTDVIGFTVAQASLMVSVLMLAGLVSNIVLIPMLERYPGRNLVRVSAGVTGILYAAWLLGSMVVGEDWIDHPDQAGHIGLV